MEGLWYVLDDNPTEFVSFSLSFPAHDEALLQVTTKQSGTDHPTDPEFEWLLGLDNVPRLAPGRNDYPTVAKGSWEDDNVFVAQIEEIGNWEWGKLRFRLTFEGDQLTLEGQVDGRPTVTIIGSVEE